MSVCGVYGVSDIRSVFHPISKTVFVMSGSSFMSDRECTSTCCMCIEWHRTWKGGGNCRRDWEINV